MAKVLILVFGYITFFLVIIFGVYGVFGNPPPQWAAFSLLFLISYTIAPVFRAPKDALKSSSIKPCFGLREWDPWKKLLPSIHEVVAYFVIPICAIYIVESKYGSIEDAPGTAIVVSGVIVFGCLFLEKKLSRSRK